MLEVSVEAGADVDEEIGDTVTEPGGEEAETEVTGSTSIGRPDVVVTAAVVVVSAGPAAGAAILVFSATDVVVKDELTEVVDVEEVTTAVAVTVD